MVRSIDAANITASSAAEVTGIFLADLDFSSGAARASTWVGTKTFDGIDYSGVGELGKIGSIGENIELEAEGVALEISGVTPTNISRALGEAYQGRTGTVYIGLLDADEQPIGVPTVMFKGIMDTQSIRLGDQGKIELNVESRHKRWRKPNEHRYNNEDQKERFPLDKGLEFTEITAGPKELLWGKND